MEDMTYLEVSRARVLLPRFMECADCVRQNIKNCQKGNKFSFETRRIVRTEWWMLG